ncbi:MAG: hypothetical protein K6D59_04500 [Bacteroidales bacterium]|nr:hypothetical protein [Bacteroidales bacterium]
MKGITNNPNGRPKGTPNKITKELRQWISEVIDANREQMIEDLKAVEPKERLQILERLLQYIIPKRTHFDETTMSMTHTISFEEYMKMLNGETIDA